MLLLLVFLYPFDCSWSGHSRDFYMIMVVMVTLHGYCMGVVPWNCIAQWVIYGWENSILILSSHHHCIPTQSSLSYSFRSIFLSHALKYSWHDLSYFSLSNHRMIGTNCCRCDPNFKSRKRHPCLWRSCSMWVVCPQVATNSQCELSMWLCSGMGIMVDDDDVKLAENTLLWKR